MKRLALVSLVTCLAVAGIASAAERKPAADFKLNDLNGKTISLSALKGKVVLLDFWATWCPPCRAEIPHFKELYATYKPQGLEIIGLSVREKPNTVKAFVKQEKINYPIGITSGREEQAYGGIRGIPTTFLIDRQGRIAETYVGYHEKEVFEGAIRKLLAE